MTSINQKNDISDNYNGLSQYEVSFINFVVLFVKKETGKDIVFHRASEYIEEYSPSISCIVTRNENGLIEYGPPSRSERLRKRDFMRFLCMLTLT
jgi:hypothetical protein